MPELIPRSARVARYIQNTKVWGGLHPGKLFWGLLLGFGGGLKRLIESRYWCWAWVIASPVWLYFLCAGLVDNYYADDFVFDGPWGLILGIGATIYFIVMMTKIVLAPARHLFKGVKFEHERRYHHGFILATSEKKFLIRDVGTDELRWIERKDTSGFVTRKELKTASLFEI